MDTSNCNEKKRRRRGAKGQTSTNEHVKDNTVGKGKPEDTLTITNANNVPKEINNSDNKSNSKKRKRKGAIPKQGEPGYLSASQLRNARKRRAKQIQKNVVESSSSDKSKTDVNLKKRSKDYDDPSTRYIKNPLSCPLVQKAKEFFADMKKDFPIYIGQLNGWRTVSKLPVRCVNDKCTIGLFRPNSHNVIAVPDCQAHHPSINKAIKMIQHECDSLHIDPYSESEGTGYFRYVCLNVERSTGKVQTTIVWNSAPYNDGEQVEGKTQLEKLTKSLLAKKDTLHLHSLWIHFNAQWKHADNIFDYGSDKNDSLWTLVYGPPHVTERLDLLGCKLPPMNPAVDLHFPPNVFRQANLNAFLKIIISIRDYISTYNTTHHPNKLPSCVELYGGVGTIGLNMVDLFTKFTSSDENPHNEVCFEKSVSMLRNHKDKCNYVPKNATDVIRDEQVLDRDCDIIIVDPPRKGFEKYVCQAMEITKGPKLLVYVSCGFDAFKRDCDSLLKSGWALDVAEGHVLFPGSDAIETLAFFKK
jgi:23S rRNA (uracil1939-C5)-methyltransferase